MKRMLLTALICSLAAWAANAQKTAGSVTGILKDSVAATTLPDATLSILRASDSTFISFTLSDKNGRFEIKDLDLGNYTAVASYTGMQTQQRRFTISAKAPHVNLGTILMAPAYKALDEIVVTESPVKINGDTISFKADAFKTKPNATVEDLLKKLPGLQVERDGTVKAQGEEVKKVYVDGKEFFSNDPKLATKNLTADMVDRVEMYDDRSEQSKFNGIDDGSRTKAINLKLKKDKKKGAFGKAYAGYGTNQRYDMGLVANIFKGATQTSVIAQHNNTNNIGFGISDMMGTFGPGVMSTTTVRMVGGGIGGFNFGNTGSGITTSSQVGVNYRDTWSPAFDVNGSYSFNHVNTNNDRQSLRSTFNNDSTLITNDHSFSGAQNDNHRFNLRLVYKIDSLNSLIFTPNLSYQKSYNTFSVDTFFTDVQKGALRYRINESRNTSQSNGNGYNASNNLLWRKRFIKNGRTLSLNLSNTLGNTDRNAYNSLLAGYFNADGEKWKDSTASTLSRFATKNNNYAASLSYTEPLSKGHILELNYNYSNNNSTSNQGSFDYNAASKDYDLVNERLTNNFKTSNHYNRLGANYRVVKTSFDYQLGLSVQQADLQNTDLQKNNVVSHTFLNLLPTASFNYKLSRTKNLRFSYRGTPRMPNVSQMQDVEDISKFPYITRGNPQLKQEFVHVINLSYNFFDFLKFRNIFAFLNFTNTQNKIASYIEQLQGGLVQRSTPVNISGGTYNINGNFNIGFPIKKLKGGNFNTNTRLSYNSDANFINTVKNFTHTFTAGEDLRLSYNYKEKLDLGLRAGITYNAVSYSMLPKNNTQYFTHAYAADASYSFGSGFMVSTDFDYTFNTGRTNGFNRNYAMWNGSLAKEVFKNKRGEIKLSVFDILNQNTSISRNTGPNYVEDVQSSVLKRYFMFTFTYRLSRMGGRSMPRVMERAVKDVRISL